MYIPGIKRSKTQRIINMVYIVITKSVQTKIGSINNEIVNMINGKLNKNPVIINIIPLSGYDSP